MPDRTCIAIDLKSFYASAECADRKLDPLTTNLVVADQSRTDKTICLAVSPALKACGILLPDDTEAGETVGFIMAGFQDKNPAVVELCEDGGALRVRATAKEGIIRQNTVKKALAKLRAAL